MVKLPVCYGCRNTIILLRGA
ncbi:hypothetical protein EFR00_06920 [Rhizobium sophoriradicis]|nr:hypothetical protein EFR00_06920 [Rhizobium sophoriradicis]